MTTWRTKLRREMNERDVVRLSALTHFYTHSQPSLSLTRMSHTTPHIAHTCLCHFILYQVARGIHTDCLLNYETVKYFCGENFEGERYAEAIREYQYFEYQVVGTFFF